MPLGILRLLTEVGEDNIEVQNILGEAFLGARSRKGGITEISFGTVAATPTDIMVGETKVALVVWLPKARVDAIRAAYNKEEK